MKVDLYDGLAGTISAPRPGTPDKTKRSVKRHGTLGDPGYPKLHPGNRGKGLRQLPPPRGGMVGSPDYTEEQHIASLEGYIDRPDVNVFLRTGTPADGQTEAEAKAESRTLNDLITIQEPLKESQEAMRGGLKLPEMSPGDTFEDRGFSSASEDESIADLFAMAPMFKGGEKGDVLHITMPAGTRVLEVYTVYPHGNEGEWILPPGTTFKVTGVTDDGYEVEVMSL